MRLSRVAACLFKDAVLDGLPASAPSFHVQPEACATKMPVLILRYQRTLFNVMRIPRRILGHQVPVELHRLCILDIAAYKPDWLMSVAIYFAQTAGRC